ncbi:MAG TPA: hypothetical protein VL996_06090 [Methylocella sp.]|nr:hypothetical protein [Methylocella sp.]
MSHEHEERRQEIKARLESAEKALSATRSTAGGHSRAIRLHLEREIHARKKDLALLDMQRTSSSADLATPAEPNKEQ